ncbi:glucokinase [Nakamurella sp. UYEF19]|uniref:ROK family protein n=1 Tax=Nakamurella sp. UYEF19 TaxID=1756392 RepID=UPI00339AE307
MSGSWLGIDLGGTYIKWELLSDDGRSIASGKVRTPTTGHLAVTEAIAALCQERMAGGGPVEGVGIAVPGHLSPERDTITLLPNVSGEWSGFAVRAYLANRIDSTPVLLNDARAFAVAELELGAAHGRSDVLFATIGTGIGGAVVVGGKVVSSGRDNFGEVGHLTAVIDGERCGCGSAGCVEAYAGGAYVLARAQLRGVTVVDGPDALPLLAREAEHNPVAERVLEQAYDAFAVGISSVCAYTGARTVVVGGAVADELDGYRQRCRDRLADRRLLLGEVEVLASSLGSRAGALGAALAARSSHSGSSHSRSITFPLSQGTGVLT